MNQNCTESARYDESADHILGQASDLMARLDDTMADTGDVWREIGITLLIILIVLNFSQPPSQAWTAQFPGFSKYKCK